MSRQSLPQVPDRTAIVTVEIQLRPGIPENASPWWHGYHQLTFHHKGEKVWTGTIECANLGSESARVDQRPGFGWVLILMFKHEKAQAILAGKGPVLPDHIDGERPREGLL